MIERPTGIIRTLPYGPRSTEGSLRLAYERMLRSLKILEAGDDFISHVYIGFSQRPTQEVLHCYLLMEGSIRVRANIAGFEAGETLGAVKCWDGSTRVHPWWALLTAPVSWADEPIRRRGFQGFRYTQDLW